VAFKSRLNRIISQTPRVKNGNFRSCLQGLFIVKMASSASLPPAQDIDDVVASLCKRLVSLSTEENFGLEAYDWQIQVGAHMNKMTCPASGISPAPIFLCQPTGGGKSLVRDGFAAGQGGITWSISPLLSLGADQETKINEKAIKRY
jgi:hypothetical protein